MSRTITFCARGSRGAGRHAGAARLLGALAGLVLALWSLPLAALDRASAFRTALVAAVADDAALLSFYQARGFAPLWLNGEDAPRRAAFLAALSRASDHGLPPQFAPERLRALFLDARTVGDAARAEVAASRLLVAYARAIGTGVLNPARIDEGIKRRVARPEPAALLSAFAASSPEPFLRGLPPQSPDYARLLREKLHLERVLGAGGWGAPAVPEGRTLRPGEEGPAIVALRERLIALGYLRRSASPVYDLALEAAVRAFQADHGLAADGVAGPVTLTEINTPVETRLGQVMVAMERERWLGAERGARHVLVNIPDFTTRIMRDGSIEFETRAVVGRSSKEQQTPEFSDEIDHMVINPTWHVPRSIAVKEYLPRLQQNPADAGYLRVVDQSGRPVDRMTVDFTQFDRSTFPFALKQPPSDANALGLVKFMFPNPYNIYLHDTPQKSLFGRDLRAYSHGCVRLADPFEFAYRLLSAQSDDPKGLFHRHLATGREIYVSLETPLPVHIIYRTALVTAEGDVQFRRDVYGRDARVLEALREAGVALRAVRG